MDQLVSPVALEITPRAVSGTQASTSSWIRGPLWDGFWMHSALWLAPIVLWLAHGYSDPEDSPLDNFYFALTAMFWIGHRLCSTWLAYGTEAYRPLLRSQPVRFIALPLLVTVACFAVFLPGDETLPWTRAERLVVFAIVDYAWVTWHFASQHFGALSLYRLRAERGSCRWTRRADRFFSLGVGGALVFVADVLAGAVAYQDRWIDGWIPESIAALQDQIRLAGMVVLVIATTLTLAVELRAPRWSLPRVLYVLGLAAMVFIALRPRSLFLFLVVWTSQHWILATGLASQLPRAERPPSGGFVRRGLHQLNSHAWALVVFLVLLSVTLLPLFEAEANRQGGTYYGDRIFGSLSSALRTSSWVPALIALGFATGFIHYLLDRGIYRMSDPQVRAAARGLISSRRD
jgi:hypothetical protein